MCTVEKVVDQKAILQYNVSATKDKLFEKYL